MPRSLSTLAAASLTANQLASLARNSNYLYNMARGRKYKRKSTRVSASANGYLTGPRYRVPRPSIRPPQLKFFQDDALGHNFTIASDSTKRLTGVSGGDNPNNRDSRFIRVINIRGQMIMPSISDCRVVIYTPLDTSDQVSLTNVQDSVDPTRFKVFYDRLFHVNGAGGTRDLTFNINFGKYGHKVNFDSVSSFEIKGPIYPYQ